MVKSYTGKFKLITKVFTLLFALTCTESWGQTTIVSENMGTTAGAHSIAANTFQNVGLAFSGTGTTNTTNGSTGYTGSSSSQNIILNNTNFQIASINTSACSNIKLSFGLFKGTTAPDGSSLLVEVSSNGATYFPCSFSVLPTGTGTTGWYLINVITSIPSTANLRIRFTESSGVTLKIDDVKLVGTCGATNSITSGVITTAPFNISACTSSVTGTIAFTSSGTFNAGNIYTVQLSDNFGGFDYPISIGALTSIAASGTITFTLPASTLAGTKYLIRIVSSNPSTISSISSFFTITSSCAPICPALRGVVANACAGTCAAEGNNEIMFLNSGSYTIPVNPTNLNISFNNGSVVNFTGSFAAQPSVVSNLNTLAGCGTLFIDASTGLVPANSNFILMNSGSCFNYDFSSYCAYSPIYIVFSSDVSWTAAGFFTNSGPTVRSFITDFTSMSAVCGSDTYTYIPDNLTNFSGLSDGGAISYSSIGGAPSYINNGCTPPPIILPIQLIDFYATKNDKVNNIVWKVEEENINYYVVEKSNDGINFTQLATVFENNSDAQEKTYSVIDDSPFDDITYYRLGTKEKHGTLNYYKTISVDAKSSDWNFHHYQQEQTLVIDFKNTIPKNSTIQLFDLSGKLLVEQTIKESQTNINTVAFAEGIYFIKITSPYKTENFKIIISK